MLKAVNPLSAYDAYFVERKVHTSQMIMIHIASLEMFNMLGISTVYFTDRDFAMDRLNSLPAAGIPSQRHTMSLFILPLEINSLAGLFDLLVL